MQAICIIFDSQWIHVASNGSVQSRVGKLSSGGFKICKAQKFGKLQHQCDGPSKLPLTYVLVGDDKALAISMTTDGTSISVLQNNIVSPPDKQLFVNAIMRQPLPDNIIIVGKPSCGMCTSSNGRSALVYTLSDQPFVRMATCASHV